MRLKVLIPSDVVVDQEVTKIKAESGHGWFCVLPKHVDFVTALVPGILSFDSAGLETEYLAVDQGVLVKCGHEVSVSTRNAVRGSDLDTLRDAVETQFRVRREKEQAMRALEAKLEADLVRELVRMEKHA